MIFTYLFQLIACFCLIQAKHYTCVHDQLYKDYKPHLNRGVSRDQALKIHIKGRQLAVLSRTPIRITLDTSYFDKIIAGANSAANTTFAHLNFIKRVMQVTQAFYQARLQVTQVVKIKSPQNCFDFDTPESDWKDGISSSDLHIYVRYVTDKGLGYGATGVSCKTFDGTTMPDSTFQYGRPVVGRIIFNTYTLLEGQGISSDQYLLTNRRFASITSTALHQTMHILGFNYALYSTYLDLRTSNGATYTSYLSGPVKLHPQRPQSYLLTTPNVLAWAEDFFGCTDMQGMQLENQDASTPGSHWQRVALYDEIMTGTALGAQKSFSGVNFALLKDMGWYDVEATFNDTNNYGYKKGCTFYNNSCYPTKIMAEYFCDPANSISYCSTSHLGKSVCDNQAGLMADGCAIWAEYLHCVDADEPGDGLAQITFEKYGINSFCISSTLGTSANSGYYQSRCYPYVCGFAPDLEVVNFTVGSYSITCLKNETGLKKTLGAIPNGNLICPDYNDFCVNSRKLCKNWCSQNGFCTRGICNCLPGFSGDDCSKTICTGSQYYNPLTNACVSSCPSGYYQNIFAKTCMKCASKCQQCIREPHICSACHSTADNPLVFYNDTCYSSCPVGTFKVGDLCFDCITTSPNFCKTCQGSNISCTSCQSTYFLENPDVGTCNLDCPDPTYKLKDMVNFKCVMNCRDNLILSGSTCILCPQGEYKWVKGDGLCHNYCLAGFFPDSTDRFCKQCDTSCESCDGGYAQNCTKCWTDKPQKYLLLKMCVSTCPTGYYANDTSGACELCLPTLNCASCYYNDTQKALKCITCKYGYFLFNEACNTGCSQYQFKNKWNNSCDNCSDQCGDCTSPYESSCKNCRTDKFYLSNQTGGYCLDDCPAEYYVKNSVNCLSCHKTCKTCNGVTSKDCASCVKGLYFSNNYCRYVCPEKTYPNDQTYLCQDCNSDCKFCFGPTVDNCTSCKEGLVLNNNTCTSSCPTGMIVNQWSVCQKFAIHLVLQFLAFAILMLLITN